MSLDHVDQALAYLRAGYTGGAAPTDRDLEAFRRLWRERFGHHPPEVFARATRRAHRAHPDWFPTIGQLQAIFDAEAKVGKPGRRAPPERQLASETPALDEASPWERLARQFEKHGPKKHLREAFYRGLGKLGEK